MVAVIQIFLALLIPFVIPKLCEKKFFASISPVGTAYLFGILLAFTPLSAPTAASDQLFTLSVGVAIVLMLLGSNPRKWLPYCTNYLLKTLCFFLILFILGLLASFIKPELNPLFALFAATFIGSAPNMAAVGVGLSLPKDLLLATQTADIIICGIYFLMIITFKEKLFFMLPSKPSTEEEKLSDLKTLPNLKTALPWTLLPTLCVLGLSLLCSKLFYDPQIGVLVSITFFSISFAFFLPQDKVSRSYFFGEKIFLIFCFLLGTKLDFKGFVGLGPETIFYGFSYLFVSLLLFLFFARILKMDREQFLVLTSAGIFSPALVGPMVIMVKRKDLLGPGMAAASLGLALGNLLGLGLSQLFNYLRA